MNTTRSRAALAVVAVGALVAVSGCSSAEAADDGTTELTVSLFGTFGYEEAGLFEKYEQENPGVTIRYETTQGEDTYWPALLTKLNAGSGAADIQGIEVARIRTVAESQGDKWVDLTTTSAADQLSDYPEWKTAAATTDDGKVLGLGTDIGPTALCYRTDLLQQAGLPTDPAQLSAQLGSWEDFVALGEEYRAAAPEGSAWHDSAGGLYNAIISTEAETYVDEAGEPVHDTNPVVRSAFDLAARAGQEGLTAKFKQFTDPEWDRGFAAGSFATIACPAWMVGYIKGKAGDAGAGKWGVTTLPGGAGGNWGGAYLGVPASSEHQEEAVKLASWLTAPEQQEAVFEVGGNFPSRLGAIDAVAGVTDDYFGGAPIGQVFGDAARQAPTQLIGADDGIVKSAMTDALATVEVNGIAPEQAWKTALDDVADQTS